MDSGNVSIDRRVFLVVRDGTRLAVTLYLPAGDGPFPAVLESVPYRKDDDCTARDWVTFTYLAERGFAGVRLDIRGSGASEGIISDEYPMQEQEDALDVLRWIADQDWCTGRVGMWGISWGGFSALQTAMLQPPELGAICAVHATHDRFACDVHYTGGSLHLAESLDWPGSMVPLNALPPDPDIVGDGWYDMWMDRLENTPQWLPTWLRHQHRDQYWLHGSPCSDYPSINAPTLLIGGWLDPYVDGILAMLEHLDAPRRAIIGPWGHFRPSTGVPSPTYDHLDLMARWFGHHLRGDANGAMDEPLATVFVRSAPPYDAERVTGYWRAEPTWPPTDGTTWTLPFSDLNHDQTTWNGPQWVGSHAPFWDRGGWGSEPDPSSEAALFFETAPLAEPVEILGTPEIDALVVVDTAVGLIAARLLVVTPQGEAHLICRGSRNLAFRDSLSSPSPVVPGSQITVRFPLQAASAIIPAGWRLRLALAGADFPVAWPPGQRFTLQVDPGQSQLLLPIVPVRSDAYNLTFTEDHQAMDSSVEVLESESAWSVTRNGDVTTFHKEVAASEIQPERADLQYENRQRIDISVADLDPASIDARTRAEVSLHRPGWHVQTAGVVEITADAGAFYLTIELTARHNGLEIWSRQWRDVIDREWA